MTLLLRDKVGVIRCMRGKGHNRKRIAASLGVTEGQVRWVMQRESLDRWDAGGVLMLELYAEHPEITPDTVLKVTRETLGITPARYGSGQLFVTPEDARRIRDHFTELLRRRDEWLTVAQAAQLIGVKRVTAALTVTRGFTWAAGIERCTVPTKGRWGYRYEPESVREAAQRRKA